MAMGAGTDRWYHPTELAEWLALDFLSVVPGLAATRLFAGISRPFGAASEFLMYILCCFFCCSHCSLTVDTCVVHKDESLVFFAGISSLGRLLHLHRNNSVPAQGELPLPGLSQPGLQQKGGRPTERNVPLWEVRQRVSQLQVPPYPLCKWLFSVFLIPYSPTNTPTQSYVNIPGVKV